MKSNSAGFKSLVPLFVFVIIFLGSGILYGSFYKFPAPIAALCGVIVALILYKDSLKENINTFVEGCGQSTIITMCLIYLLAGGFAALVKEIGSVEAIVYYSTHYLSLQYLYAGTFLLAAFLSFASGTSVGSIATIAPAIIGFTDIPSIQIPLLAAALLCGAMFGDNLSFISDTTIAATQTQGCSMRDKFLVNAKMAIPAAIISFAIFIYMGFQYHPISQELPQVSQSSSLILILPYLAVIILAIIGLNVFLVLFIGIVFSYVIGAFVQDLEFLNSMQIVYDGFVGMNEVFLLSMFTGGLAFMVKKEGGMDYIFNLFNRYINSPNKTKSGIAAFSGLINLSVANNTVAILIAAPIAKKLSANYKINPAYTASILDISTCIVQGFIPYGAQILLLIQIIDSENLGYLNLISQTYYLWLLPLTAIIYFRFIAPTKMRLTESV